MRGLPPNTDLQKPPIARVLSKVLRDGSIPDSTTGEDATALDECYRKGWLHAYKVPNGATAFTFASQLHHLFVEWKLQDFVPPKPIESNSILHFALEVIARFSPDLLSAERRIGAGCIQRLPEVQYQDEFYRCCHESLITLPEYGTMQGRVDFYIPSKEWGVELLRDGNQLGEYWSRFSSESGSYGTTISLSDFIILDCRNTWPKRRHPSMCIF